MAMWILLHRLQIHLMLGVHATLRIWMHYWSWVKMKKACKLLWNTSLFSGSGNWHAHMENIGINVVLPGPLRVGDLIFCQKADILIITWTYLCLASIFLAHATGSIWVFWYDIQTYHIHCQSKSTLFEEIHNLLTAGEMCTLLQQFGHQCNTITSAYVNSYIFPLKPTFF